MVHSTAVQGSGTSAKGQETETERIKGGKKGAVKTRNAFKAGSFSSCIITFCLPNASPLFYATAYAFPMHAAFIVH